MNRLRKDTQKPELDDLRLEVSYMPLQTHPSFGGMSGEKHEDLSAFISTGERAQREKEKEDQQQGVKGQLRVLASTQRSPCTMSNGAAFHVAVSTILEVVN